MVGVAARGWYTGLMSSRIPKMDQWPLDMEAVIKCAGLRRFQQRFPVVLALAYALNQNGYRARAIKQPAIYWKNNRERTETNFYAVELGGLLLTLDRQTSWDQVAQEFCKKLNLDPKDPMQFRLRDELTHMRSGQKTLELLEGMDTDGSLRARVGRAVAQALGEAMDARTAQATITRARGPRL